jgi:hypothetical protein
MNSFFTKRAKLGQNEEAEEHKSPEPGLVDAETEETIELERAIFFCFIHVCPMSPDGLPRKK